MTYYRRNVNCLSTESLHDLREALAAVYALPASHKHSWMRIAGLHGLPNPIYCIHGIPGFLTWHRPYLLALEEALRCQRPNVTLPYWNWSSGPTTGLPPACSSPTYVNRDGDTVANPLYAGPLPPGAGGSMTSRRGDIDTTTFGDIAASAQTAIANADFDDFQSGLNGAHGSIHVRIGGNMGSVSYAGYDPIFWLHHANVDRLWANWQAAHPAPLPANEANQELEPFNRPFSTSWQTGADVFSTDALGYKYANFCILVLKWPLKAIMEVDLLPPWVRERLASAKLVLRSTRMAEQSAELRVFVNEPRPAEAPATVDNPRFAGTVGIFGMRASAASAPTPEPARQAVRSAVAAVVGAAAAVSTVRHAGHDHAAHTHEPAGHAHTHTSNGGHAHGEDCCCEEHGFQHVHRPGERFDLQLDITRAARSALEKEGTLSLSLAAIGVDGKTIENLESLPFEAAELRVE